MQRAILVTLCAGALLVFLAVPSYPTFDGEYHIVWAGDVLHGRTPAFDALLTPTEHPANVLLAMPAAIAGDRVLVLETLLCAALLLFFTYRLTAHLYGVPAGVAAAFLLGIPSELGVYSLSARVDVPFAAAVVAAAALAVARPERRLLPMAVLAFAGLLRPEGWLLAGAYWLWCLPRTDRRARLQLTALLVAGPLIWALVDLSATGDPLLSRNHVAQTAEILGGTSASDYLTDLPRALTDVIPWYVVVSGLAGAAAAAKLRPRTLPVPVAIAAAGGANYVGAALSGFLVESRYLLLPAVSLAIFAGYAGSLVAERVRRTGFGALGAAGLAAAAAVLVLVAALPDHRSEAAAFRAASRDRDKLAGLLGQSAVRRSLGCGPVVLPTHLLGATVRLRLDIGADKLVVREPRPAYGLFLQFTRPAQVAALATLGSPRLNEPAPGATRIGATDGYVAWAKCPR